jgi:sterol desaturase/sphingolipid hydroxylase (fatty acid hydroxylase superfamily)
MIAIGVGPQTLWLWQAVLFASILFHHANVRLPVRLERVLVRLIVTPRMHGIHHSVRVEETNSNYSSLLSVWDWLQHTLRLREAGDRVVIGVPAYASAEDVTIGRLLVLPFRSQRKDWLGEGGMEP